MLRKYKYLQIVNGNIEISDGTTIRAKRIFHDLIEGENNLMISLGRKNRVKNYYIVGNQPQNYLLRLFTWTISLFFILCRLDAKVVYLSNDFVGSLVVYILRPFKKWKVIFEAHGILSKESIEIGKNKIETKLSSWLEKKAVASADAVIALSGEVENYYRKFNQSILLAPVYIDLEVMKNIDTQKDSSCVGLIGPFTGPFNRAQIDFLRENSDKIKNKIKFKLIGDNKENIDSGRVHFTGYVKELGDYYREIKECKLIIVPTVKSTSGPLNKILESMALGIPVIATKSAVKGIDGLVDNKNVFITNLDEMTKMINEKIDDKSLESLGLEAKKFVEDNYSKEIILSRIKNILERLAQ